MDKSSRRLPWTSWAGLALTALLIGVALLLANLKSSVPLPVYGQVGAFTLTNQLGRVTTLDDLRGQVWIADIIFTRCPGPCAKMSRQMADLQTSLSAGLPVKLVSLTTDPEFDTPEIMKRYGERFGADNGRWMLLTGAKSEIGRFARDGLKLVAVEKKPEERDSDTDLFIHSTRFGVVDKQGRLRKVFDTQPGIDDNGQPETDPKKLWEESRGQILAAVKQLLREE